MPVSRQLQRLGPNAGLPRTGEVVLESLRIEQVETRPFGSTIPPAGVAGPPRRPMSRSAGQNYYQHYSVRVSKVDGTTESFIHRLYALPRSTTGHYHRPPFYLSANPLTENPLPHSRVTLALQPVEPICHPDPRYQQPYGYRWWKGTRKSPPMLLARRPRYLGMRERTGESCPRTVGHKSTR